MSDLKLDLGDIRQLSNEDYDGLHRHIRARCDRWTSRTVAYALVSIFRELAGGFELREIISTSDSMGGLEMKLRLEYGPCTLEMAYEQSITESWQHVDIDRFERGASLPAGVYFTWDLNLAGTGTMNVNITGISGESARTVLGILGKCFGSVEPRGERERRLAAGRGPWPGPAAAPEPPRPAPGAPAGNALDSLVAVFDRERDPYMEWHDGPTLQEVDYAMARLSVDERTEASRIVAERIRKSYDPYLGRAAELLATEECRDALGDALAASGSAYNASSIARNLLATGRSAEAVEALANIISDWGRHWSPRIDALVHLKIALESAGDGRPRSGLITPELEAVIYDAVEDDDYLVRYHAAEALLKAAGIKKELSEHAELFGHICGKNREKERPGEEERAGFKKAAEMIRKMAGK